LNVVVHPADVQDRDGAFYLLRRARRLFPFIKRIFADGGYAGEKMALVVWRTGTWKLEIVKRPDAIGFDGLVQKMDRRKDIRLDQPQSSLSPRFRTLRHNSCRVRPLGHDPHHAKAACCRKRLVVNPSAAR
jgi:hypothetical protein